MGIEHWWALGIGGHWALVGVGHWWALGVGHCSLIPRPSTSPVFDRLQYTKAEGEGLGNFIT